MAKSFNQVVLVGNLTRQPEIRTTANGKAVCYLNLAVNRSYKKDGQWQDVADFLDVQVWDQLAEYVSGNADKGQPIFVSGRLASFTQERDGHKVTKTHVVADKIIILAFPVVDSLPKKDVVLDDIEEKFNINDIPF